MEYQFKRAKAIWGKEFKHNYNQFMGFYTSVSHQGNIQISIAARSYYRLYINGKMKAHGPARTAAGYCRVDQIDLAAEGNTKISIEVAAYDKPEKYCNDCTLEPGMFCCEIITADGEVLAATGESSFLGKELLYRRELVELMSHCRTILEYCDLDRSSYDWRIGACDDWIDTIPVEQPRYLRRNSPLADLNCINMRSLSGICDVEVHPVPDNKVITIAKIVNAKWYEMLPEENCFVSVIRGYSDLPFSGTWRMLDSGKIEVKPGKYPIAVSWERGEAELGFICLKIEVKEETIIDLIGTEHKTFWGKIEGNSYVSRYHLMSGKYELVTFEPKLVRYIRVVIHTKGTVSVDKPYIMDYSYPDTKETFFSCSDGDLNRIYESARRTLRLNTLDIFMDCPERERGGWLCDSYFTSAAAWQLLGDLSVEKDFIENFMLTNPNAYKNGFFPEVYPSVKKDTSEPGIRTWSFWLLMELYDFSKRTGNPTLIRMYEKRVDKMIEGMLSLRGDSGLLDSQTTQFVDWSLSNNDSVLKPISVPVNCLLICALEKMAELYHREDWKYAANEMRGIVEEMDAPSFLNGKGDSASLSIIPFGPAAGSKKLRRGDIQTESGTALELWSGFHKENDAYIRDFIDTMGYSPEYRSDPNIGKSNMFIGIMVRFDVLSQMGQVGQLIKEMKDIYLEELKDGSGTFFENYNQLSGCHGFNGYAGKLLVNKVLGLGEPNEKDKTVSLCPYPDSLRWAAGSAKVSDGMIFMNWSSNPHAHTLEISIMLPEGWRYELDLPFEYKNWKVILRRNKENINE